MVKGIVKTNKANDTKYIYLSKDCGFNDGQEVDIKFRGIGIYNKEKLKEYFEENREMFMNIKSKIQEESKKSWIAFYEQAEVFGKYLDYGKLEWDEEFYFEKNNEYSASPDGDIGGGYLGYEIRKEEIEELVKKKKLTPEQVKKELIDYLVIKFLQNKSEETIEDERRKEIEMMKEFGFENVEDNRYSGYETTLYSNGIVQLWYNAEDLAYNKTINISTMREVDCAGEENIEF